MVPHKAEIQQLATSVKYGDKLTSFGICSSYAPLMQSIQFLFSP